MHHKSKIHPTTYQPNVCRLNLKKDIHLYKLDKYFFFKCWLFCIVLYHHTLLSTYYICGKICPSHFHILSKKEKKCSEYFMKSGKPAFSQIHTFNKYIKKRVPAKKHGGLLGRPHFMNIKLPKLIMYENVLLP